jgi:hypothetical protein
MSQLSKSLAVKKFAQKTCGLISQNATHDFHPMVRSGVVEDFKCGACGSRLWVIGSEDQALDSCVGNRACTHRTRLNRNIDRAAQEPVIGELAACAAQRQSLGVRGRIAQVNGPIVSARDQASLINHNSPHWNLTLGCGPFGFAEGGMHPLDVFRLWREALRRRRSWQTRCASRQFYFSGHRWVQPPRAHGLIVPCADRGSRAVTG